MKVAKGCSSCIHAGNDFARAMRVACSAVAVPNDTGSQSKATAMTSNAPLGVSLRHFLNTHAIPASKAWWSALEGLVTDVASEPDPLLEHPCAPCVALRTGHGQALDNPLQKQ